MSVTLRSFVKQLLLFVVHLFLTVVFAIMTWGFWGLYGEEKLSGEYQREGQLEKVVVTDLSTEKRQWTDYLGNVEYISFNYKGKPYTARYVESPSFVNQGTEVLMLYDARLNAFHQPANKPHFTVVSKSRLVEWTSISLFSSEHTSLTACLIVSVAFFFLLSGLVARIPGLGFLKSVNGFVFTLLLLFGTVFLTYDAVVYYRYYHLIKESGERTQVVVLDKDRYQLTKNTRTDNFPLYAYSARVSFRNAERVIPISESDYETLPKGSKIEVFYAASVDDMMAVDYPINFWTFVFVGVIWLLLLFVAGRWIGRIRRKEMAS